MYSELDSFSFLDMSNSDVFSVKEDQKVIKYDTSSSSSSSSSTPTLESSDKKKEFKHHHDPPQQQYHRPEEDQKEDVKKEEEKCETSHLVLGQSDVTLDDDQGFRTPTSSDNKIPESTQCPGAPRKSRENPSTKRKASSPRAQTSLQLDLSEEIESMFPPTIQEGLGRKIKKARKDHDDDEE